MERSKLQRSSANKITIAIIGSGLLAMGLTTLAYGEKLPKLSADYKANVEIALKDHKAQPAVAACVAASYELTKNKKYRYDRFGFTQQSFDQAMVKTTKSPAKAAIGITIQGEARQRNGAIDWDKITVQCSVKNNAVTALAVRKTK